MSKRKHQAPKRPRFLGASLLKASIGFIAVLVGLAATTLGLSDRFIRPEMAATLTLRYEGFKLELRNIGRSIGEDTSVDIVGWRQGAPASEVSERHSVKNLISNEDFTVWPVLKVSEYASGHDLSGYIVVSCRRCVKPKAWAFFIPGYIDQPELYSHLSVQPEWPLAEFEYPDQRPKFGYCVDYPVGACKNGAWHDMLWRATTGNTKP